MKVFKKLSPDRYYDENTQVLQKLQNELDTFDYGTIIDGVRYDETQLDKIDWDSYKTLPVYIVKNEKIGNCWDFVNYQHNIFDSEDIQNFSYMFVMDRTGEDNYEDIVTHTFSIVVLDGQKFWFENAFYKYRGLWRIKDFYDVISILKKHYDPHDKYDFEVYQYDPTGLDNYLSGQEFFEKVSVDSNRVF